MFDDQQQEPQDIFSEVTPPNQQDVTSVHHGTEMTQPPSSTISENVQKGDSIQKEHGGFNPKLLVIVVAVLALLVVGAVALQYILRSKGQNTPQMPPSATSQTQTPTPSVPVPASSTSQTQPLETQNQREPASLETQTVLPQETAAPEPAPSIPLDSDNDGLIDEKEQSLGTSPILTDTDQDGINDYDEVTVYLSDPLLPDTDGDTFLDGQEVQNGYNPRGAGKLESNPPSQTAPAVVQ